MLLDRLRRIGPAWPLVVAAMSLPMLGLVVATATSSTWLPWFDASATSVTIYLLVGALVAALCLLPTHVTSLAAGYLFGWQLGVAVAWLVVLLASVIAFVLWRRLCRTRAVHALATRPRARAVHDALLGRSSARTGWLIALLRLSPLMPFAFTNILLAAFGVRLWVFLLATMVGITPRAVAVALVGAELAELAKFDWNAAAPPWVSILSVAATVAVALVIGRLAFSALRRALPVVDTAGAGDSAA